MIKTYSNLLSENELSYLLEKCDSFIKTNKTIPDGKNWFYNSMFLYGDENLSDLGLRLNELVGNEYNIQYNGIFINKITSETNKDDDYHRDESDLTIVTYLNDEFVGGEFEYIQDNEIYRIKPMINLSVMMDKKVLHKVTTVVSGNRYSLITWFRLKNKNII